MAATNVEKALENAEAVSNQSPDDADIVDWDGEDDPKNPQNWPNRKKWAYIIAVSAITFNQAMSSTIFAPGVPQAMTDLHSDNPVIATLLVSIYIIGLAFGPLFLSPLSELYGRMPLMHITNVTFVLSAVLCAVSVNVPMLLIFRLVMGMSTISLGGGYVVDLMEPDKRHRAMNVWTVGPVMAPIVGPIAGGYISLSASWRWTFGLVGIAGAWSAVGTLFMRETYQPRLLELKARHLRRETGNLNLRSKYDGGQTAGQKLGISIIRPCKMLFRSPIVGIVSLFLAIAYSYMYLMFTSFPDVFKMAYSFNSGEAGLAYLGLGIGSLIGQLSLDVYWTRRKKRRSDVSQKRRPEDQLPPLIVAGLFLGAGLCWYGWAAQYHIHWIVPILGTAMCGIGIMYFFVAVQTYLVEAYTLHAASALAASSLVRCIFGAVVPLAGPSLYASLGLGWGNTLLGFCALTVVPASLYLVGYGETIRKNPRFTPKL